MCAAQVWSEGVLSMKSLKICCKCKVEKSVSEFGSHARAKDKLQYACRNCVNVANSLLAKKNPEAYKARITAHRIANADRLRVYKAEHYLKNRERYRLKMKMRREAIRAVQPTVTKIKRAPRGKDPVKHAAALERYKQRHAAEIVARARAWNNAHPEVARAHLAKRRAKKKCATVAWANDSSIKETYRIAELRTKMTGLKWEVDHIVPLQSSLVCGLHCEANLRVIPRSENLEKSNTYWPDMP